MASFTAKIGSLDIAQYVRVTPGDGLDPANSPYLEMSFADSPLRDGGPLINIDAHNREIVLPVALSSTTKDGLHALVQQINNEMQRPSIDFEWKDQGATNSTFFDIQSARMDVEYNFRRAQKFWLFATIHVWTGPHGNTATSRLLASITSSGMAQSVAPATVVQGDMGAQGVWQVTVGSVAPADYLTIGRYIGVAALPASYTYRFPAASLTGSLAIQAAAGVASGAQDQSFGVAQLVSSGPFNLIGRVNLQNVGNQYAGRNRVYVTGRSYAEPNVAMYMADWEENRAGPTVVASGTKDWHLYDMGVLNVPTAGAPSQLQVSFYGRPWISRTTPTAIYQTLNFNRYFNAAPGSGSFHINEVLILPEPNHALLTDDVGVPSLIAYDDFAGDGATTVMGQVANTGQSWATGLSWAPSIGYGYFFNAGGNFIIAGGAIYPEVIPSSSIFNSQAAMRMPSTNLAEFRTQIGFSFATNTTSASVMIAPSTMFGVRKEIGSTIYIGARVGPSQAAAGGPYLAIDWTGNAASVYSVPSLMSSMAIPSFNVSMRHRLYADFRKDKIIAWVVADDAQAPTALLASTWASSAAFGGLDPALAGDPGIWAQRSSVGIAGGNTAIPWYIFDFRVESIPTQRVAARDVYVLDGVAGEAWRRPLNGDITQRLTHKLRGQIPKVPQSTQAQRIAAFAIGLPEGSASDLTDVSVAVREQFRFAR